MPTLTFDRKFVLACGAGLVVLALIAIVALRILGEPGNTNSYAMLAEAFRLGRLDVDRCFDVDCAVNAGKTWVVFPPAPALIALPFVAWFGTAFAHFIALGTGLTALTLWLWWRIIRALGLERDHARWLLVAIAFATPLYYLTIRTDGVWGFAQVAGMLFLACAIHEALHQRLLTAGFALGLAFLSRQMLILQAPFLFALALRAEDRLISFERHHLGRATALGVPILAAIAVYLIYNAVRFGNPLDTGYAYITAGADPNMITHRITDIGLFSPKYLTFNALYLLVQGFHVDFVGCYMTELGKIDAGGTSILAASPFILLAFFAPMRRDVVVGLICAAVIVGITLFYHSNGYTQYNVQRYTLDWLPVIFMALALGPAREHAGAFRLLVVYALALNAVTMLLLRLTVAA